MSPQRNTERVQEAHITIGRILCGLLESIVFAGAKPREH